METEKPRDWRSFPSDAEIIPFPKDEVTPPVTNMYFVDAIRRFGAVLLYLWSTKVDDNLQNPLKD